jgi:hypothetical protein
MGNLVCKEFAALCETYLSEVSSSLDKVKTEPGGKEVVVYLHKNMDLAHDQPYKEIEKISWSDLKDSYRGAWVIIKGQNGVGAIRAKNKSYEAVASTGGEPQFFKNDRGGNIIDFLKGQIGKLQKFHVGQVPDNSLRDKKRDRELRNKLPSPNEVSREKLLAKFKPLWLKAMQTAEADIKGMVATMIKNGAYDKALKKMDYLKKLDDGIINVQEGGSPPDFLSKSLSTALAMAASHYYPEQTGDISRPRWGGAGGFVPANEEGIRMLMKDISGGDQKKLGTVLAFFKRSLIA